jgi:hypothetical protein
MPDLATATPGLLQLFTPELRREAVRLVEDDAVISLDIDENEVVAEVGLDDRSVGVRWLRSEAGWKGQSDAGEALNELVLCVVLVAVARRSEAPTEADLDLEEEDFQAWLERDLGRGLVEGELAYLEKVEKRFRRARQVGAIYDQDMVRLHPRWNIESMEALELWPSSPRSLREFWSYVALALDEKGLAIPKFLLKAADLKRGRERLARWKRSLQLPRWVERVRTVARARLVSELPEALEEAEVLEDFRVLVTTSELRVQGKVRGETGFQSLTHAQLMEWGARQAQGGQPMAAAAALLLRLCVDHQREHGVSAFRLDSPEAASLLLGLLGQEALGSRLVTLDEVPLRWAAERLQWTETLQGDGQHLQLELVTEAGSATPLPLRVLTVQPAVESLYLSPEAVHRGPLWFGEENRVEGPIEVPMAALTSEDGVRFLERLQVPLPGPIQQRIVHEPLSVEVRAGCLAKSALSSAEYVVFQVNAMDEKGRVVERMRTTGWEEVTTQEAAEADGRIVIREREQLGKAEQALEVFRTTFDPEHQAFRVRLTRQFPEQFHAWAQALPEGLALHPDERLQTILADPLIARVRLEARQTESIDWFDLRLMFEIEGAELNSAEIRRLVAARGGFVRLADGSWKRVELQLSEEQQAMIDQLGIELEELGDDSHRLHWRQLANENAELLVPAEAWKLVSRRLAAAELEERPAVPAELNLTLRPYQVDGYHFLTYLTLNRFGGILADDMGLGKTVQSITWMLWLRSQQPPDELPPPVLVVCPKSVLDVWGAELGKTAPGLAVQVLRERDELSLELLTEHLDVLVINYAQLRGAIGELKEVTFLAVILDEGQQIKNPDSQAARAARQLRAQNRLVLTGTPLENRLLDLWSLMTFATPGALGDRSYFQKHFDRRKDGRAAARLSARLRPFLLRRTKGQVARDLPSRSEEALLCEMTVEQSKLYQAELARAQQMVLTASTAESMNRNRFAILQALTRLRQVCCQPQLVHGTGDHGDSAKLTATLELIEGLHAEGHKVLLFSQFVKMLEILRERLMDMGVPYHWLTGATSDRAAVVKAFQEDEEASVFLLSLKAGGAGLNLTAASYVILYDPWWNPAVEAQAIDRAHRIGQTQPVMAYRMITKATIEEKILLLQQKKQMMSANVLGEEAFSRTLDRNDFAFLFDLEREEAAWQEELKGGGGI